MGCGSIGRVSYTSCGLVVVIALPLHNETVVPGEDGAIIPTAPL